MSVHISIGGGGGIFFRGQDGGGGGDALPRSGWGGGTPIPGKDGGGTPFQGRMRGGGNPLPRSEWGYPIPGQPPPSGLDGEGVPHPWSGLDGGTPPRDWMGVPHVPVGKSGDREVEQLRGGRYASCVHAGGLSSCLSF